MRENYGGQIRVSLVAVLEENYMRDDELIGRAGQVVAEIGYHNQGGRNRFTCDCGVSIDTRFRSWRLMNLLAEALEKKARDAGMHRIETFAAVTNKPACIVARALFGLPEGVKKEAFLDDEKGFVDVNMYGKVLK